MHYSGTQPFVLCREVVLFRSVIILKVSLGAKVVGKAANKLGDYDDYDNDLGQSLMTSCNHAAIFYANTVQTKTLFNLLLSDN